jgi:hypothetical protein
MNSSDTHFLNKNFCRDSKEGFRNLLKSGAPDGYFWSPETPLAPVIAPLIAPAVLCPDLCLKAKVAGSITPRNSRAAANSR